MYKNGRNKKGMESSPQITISTKVEITIETLFFILEKLRNNWKRIRYITRSIMKNVSMINNDTTN